MSLVRTHWLALALAALPSFAADNGCKLILAWPPGDGGWAPRMQGFNCWARTAAISGADRLARLRHAVRLTTPALLSRCLRSATSLAADPTLRRESPGPLDRSWRGAG
jgi:hypothetical protein